MEEVKIEEDVKAKKETLKDGVESLADHVEQFLKTYYKLIVLRITDRIVNIASAVIGAVAILVFSFFLVLFAGIGVAWWLGDLVNSRAGGFFLMALIFAALMVTILLIRKKILFPFFRDKFIKKFYDK